MGKRRSAVAVAALVAAGLAGCGRSSSPPPGPPPPAFTTPAPEIAAVAVPGEAAPPMVLGEGSDRVAGGVAREACVQGTVTTLGNPTASISTDIAWAEPVLDPDGWTGPGADLLADAGPVGHFLRGAAYAPHSDAGTVPLFLITTSDDLLEPPWQPLLVVDAPDFTARCGDDFVQGRRRGGQLLLLVRRDWLDAAAFLAWRQAVPSSAWGLNALNMLEPAEAFIPLAGRMAIHVEVLQRGGDPERLSRRVRPAGSAEVAWSWSRDCGAADVRPCRDLIQQVFAYAFDGGAAGFGDAVAARPADLTRIKRPWDMVGGPAPRNPSPELTAARSRLEQEHATQVAIQERLRVLTAGLLVAPPDVQARLPGAASRLAANLAALEAAARACREELVATADAAQVGRCLDGAAPAGLAAAGFDPTLGMAELTPAP